MKAPHKYSQHERVWLTGFWGFSPEEVGTLGYTSEPDRARFIAETSNPQLVCIYGTQSPETAFEMRRQLLGVILVEHVEIDAWEKMSDASKKKSVDLGRQNKWRYGMPVRRAWRSQRQIDVTHVFQETANRNGLNQYTAKFGTWLTDDESRWLLTEAPLKEVDVFGEPSIDPNRTEAKLIELFKPSRAILGAFGERSYSVRDTVTFMYLAQVDSNAELFAGRPVPKGWGVYKIGISKNLTQRSKALNLSFPPASSLAWKIVRSTEFQNRSEATHAEDRFKELAEQSSSMNSLGREFFLLKTVDAERWFNSLSNPTGMRTYASGLPRED